MERTDIVSFGVVAVDDTYIVDGLPEPDTKKPYVSSRRTGGGQSATALVAAARLGCSCRWYGNLGDDDLSDFTRRVFEREGIGFEAATPFPEAAPVHAIIINDSRTGSRTLMWNESRTVPLAVTDEHLRAVERARCLFVDQCTPETQLAAARHAAAKNVAIVSDIEWFGAGATREIAELSDHFIIPASMLAQTFGESDIGAALAKALRFGRKTLVCVTDGVKGSWFATMDRPDEVGHQPAFMVEPVVDTNGCGDVFHGAYAAFLVKDFPAGERIRRAAAAAALKVRKTGGQEGAPDAAELERFLSDDNSAGGI